MKWMEKLNENIKKTVRSWLNIVPANPYSFQINEILDFEAHAIRNRIWYRGDGNELEQLYDLLLMTDGTVTRAASSSKRYKDIGDAISEMDIDNWYKIEPVWAKYKDGYLAEGDENEGRYMPMFIAEDVEKHFPQAATHANNQIEDWNYRMMIPAMFAMIKQQKEEIESLKQAVKEMRGN